MLQYVDVYDLADKLFLNEKLFSLQITSIRLLFYVLILFNYFVCNNLVLTLCINFLADMLLLIMFMYMFSHILCSNSTPPRLCYAGVQLHDIFIYMWINSTNLKAEPVFKLAFQLMNYSSVCNKKEHEHFTSSWLPAFPWCTKSEMTHIGRRTWYPSQVLKPSPTPPAKDKKMNKNSTKSMRYLKLFVQIKLNQS